MYNGYLYFAPDPNVVDPKRFKFISNPSKFKRQMRMYYVCIGKKCDTNIVSPKISTY